MKARLAHHPRVGALRRMLAVGIAIDCIVDALGAPATPALVRSYQRSKDYRAWLEQEMPDELRRHLPLDALGAAPPSRVGRSHYDPALAEEIVQRISEGETLEQITHSEHGAPHLPGRSTLYRWMQAVPAFELRIEKARDYQAHFMVEEGIRLCREAIDERIPRPSAARIAQLVDRLLDELETEHELPRPVAETVVRRCLAITRERTDAKVLRATLAHLRWVAEKRLRQRYGDTQASGDPLGSLARLLGMEPGEVQELVDQLATDANPQDTPSDKPQDDPDLGAVH